MWYKFASLAGESQTLFELSNGFGTEHIYVRRIGSTRDLVFGVEHSQWGGERARAEHRTLNGSGINAGYWQHVAWSIQHILDRNTSSSSSSSYVANGSMAAGGGLQQPTYYLLPESLFFAWSSLSRSFESASQLVGVRAMALGYRATWNIYLNGGSGSDGLGEGGSGPYAYENLEGMLMPVEGAYSVNYVGYGTFFSGSFFSGSVMDLRLYERPLDLRSIRAIFSGDACCTAFTAGSYMDPSKRCTSASTHNSEFCRSCKSDCGPLNFIENEDNACSGMLDRDNTLCARCLPCGEGQFINKTCSGTSFNDEGSCIPCRCLIGNADCFWGLSAAFTCLKTCSCRRLFSVFQFLRSSSSSPDNTQVQDQ